MVTRSVRNPSDFKMLVRFLENKKTPFVVEITDGRPRSVEQNRLQRLWCKEIAEQLEGHSAEEIRGFCKLHFGVPIMRENEAFRAKYDEVVRPMPYEQKLALMMEPFGLPVTSLMKVEQKTRYLDAVRMHFLELGVVLTEPEDRARAAA